MYIGQGGWTPNNYFMFQLWCCPGREWLSGGSGDGALYTPSTGPSVVARQRDGPGGGAIYTPSTGPLGRAIPSITGKVSQHYWSQSGVVTSIGRGLT